MGAARFGPSRLHVDMRRELPRTFAGLAALVVAALAVLVLVEVTHYDVWSSVITYLVLLLATAPLLSHFAKVDGDPKLFRILMWALAIKLAMAMARYFMINVLYGGGGDAAIYHAGAVSFANNIRNGHLSVELGPFLEQRPDETRRISIFTGIMYLITGPSIYSGFFIHSWFGFLGNLALVRAFRRGFPEGLQRRYTLVVLFLPSLLFWPSAVGKDGWMLMTLGLAGYGASRLLAPTPSLMGVPPLALGIGGMVWIRPHMAVIVAMSLAVAILFMAVGRRDGTDGRPKASFAVRFMALGLVTVMVLVTVSLAADRFGGGSTGATFSKTVEQTQIGNSAFESAAVRSPLDLPMATLSVLFRPFVWEVRNANALIAAAEGLLLAGILWMFRSGLKNLFWTAWRRPYVAFCLVYTMAFIVAFSNIANAAILSRQRTQLLGLFLVVVAIPASRRWHPDGRADDEVADSIDDSVDDSPDDPGDDGHDDRPQGPPDVRADHPCPEIEPRPYTSASATAGAGLFPITSHRVRG